MFYGGVYHNYAKYSDVSKDGKEIIMCGDSYSYNFVNKTLQSFMIKVNADTGLIKWGKYYQDDKALNYIGLLHICKINKANTKIFANGGLNMYKPIIATFDYETGKVLEIMLMNT